MYICQLLSFNLLHKKKQIVVLWLQWDFPAWELAVTIPIYSYFFIPHWRYSAHWVHVRSQSNHIKLIPTNVSLQFILSPQPTHMMSSLQWAINLSTQICLGCGRKCEFLGEHHVMWEGASSTKTAPDVRIELGSLELYPLHHCAAYITMAPLHCNYNDYNREGKHW